MLGARIERQDLFRAFEVQIFTDNFAMVVLDDYSRTTPEKLLFNPEKYPNTVKALEELRKAMIADGGKITGFVTLEPENRSQDPDIEGCHDTSVATASDVTP